MATPQNQVAMGTALNPGKARKPPQREWRPGLRAMPRQERIKRERRFAKKGSPLPPDVVCPVARARYPLGPRWGFTVVPHLGPPQTPVMPHLGADPAPVMCPRWGW